MIFDGIAFAKAREEDLKKKIKGKLKLAVWLDPSNVAGVKYVERKMQMAKKLGVEVVLNRVDGDEDGVMVQMPHPNAKFLIDQIDPRKDVDGLKENSLFVPATVRAVKEILSLALQGTSLRSCVVVGSKGMVGRGLMKELGCEGMDKEDFDPEKLKQADVIISATGVEGLIKPEMVKDGVVAIDVGYPKGDFDPEVAKKASFFTPVPGGVGPVTVACLFANLLDAAL